MWYIGEAIQTLMTFAMIGAVMWALLQWMPVPDWWVWLAGVALGGLILAGAIGGPAWRYRTWRYEVREDEVDLQHGWLVQTRALIPMSRIQHVDTRRGPIEGRYGLASVVFYTAAGSMEIPALSQEVAASVRNRIGELAKVHDDL